MAHFLLFVFMFAGQLIAGYSTQKLPPPNYGDTISILSIDGGGIKGIIPARVLDHLDKALKAKDPNANLAHYFDVIAGTSTGGLIAAALASPSSNDPNRPTLTPSELVQFYKENGPHIFNESSAPEKGPKFDGTFLHNITRELLKETRLSQTLTNVVIPTFDMKKEKAVIFSSYKLKTLPYLNVKVSDICLGTTAAPTQLPPYYFTDDGHEFNLIDGGLVAGNPTQVAIGEVTEHSKNTKIEVLSLGTAVTKVIGLDARFAAFWDSTMWAILGQIYSDRASTDITEYYHAILFSHFLPSNSNYLRIQEYDLDFHLANPTSVSKENLDELEEVGKKLLQKNVRKINVDTFDEEEGQGTNAEALDSLAERLYQERQLRLKRKSMEKGGRPFIESATLAFN